MKASEARKLILSELKEFKEFRPSKKDWVSSSGILKKCNLSNDMHFAMSLINSLVEDKYILVRPSSPDEKQSEAIVQITDKGISYLKDTSEEKNRNEQYLRILTSGISGESDYEAVKYLKDKGYTDSPVRISRGRGSYGKVINVVWQGANSHGLDFIDELRARTNHDNSKLDHEKQSNNASNGEIKKLPQKPTKSSWVTIAEGVAIIVIGAMIFFLLHKYLGISLK
ncbi:MAG: hypothetical protein KAR12_17655 [Methylococcales bacterium]|nr:hypothetical protein [Methylococcales bacterium]